MPFAKEWRLPWEWEQDDNNQQRFNLYPKPVGLSGKWNSECTKTLRKSPPEEDFVCLNIKASATPDGIQHVLPFKLHLLFLPRIEKIHHTR